MWLVLPQVTQAYGSAEFREELRSLFELAGVHGHRVTFLITEGQIADESFLEDINAFLNSGARYAR